MAEQRINLDNVRTLQDISCDVVKKRVPISLDLLCGLPLAVVEELAVMLSWSELLRLEERMNNTEVTEKAWKRCYQSLALYQFKGGGKQVTACPHRRHEPYLPLSYRDRWLSWGFPGWMLQVFLDRKQACAECPDDLVASNVTHDDDLGRSPDLTLGEFEGFVVKMAGQLRKLCITSGILKTLGNHPPLISGLSSSLVVLKVDVLPKMGVGKSWLQTLKSLMSKGQLKSLHLSIHQSFTNWILLFFITSGMFHCRLCARNFAAALQQARSMPRKGRFFSDEETRVSNSPSTKNDRKDHASLCGNYLLNNSISANCDLNDCSSDDSIATNSLADISSEEDCPPNSSALVSRLHQELRQCLSSELCANFLKDLDELEYPGLTRNKGAWKTEGGEEREEEEEKKRNEGARKTEGKGREGRRRKRKEEAWMTEEERDGEEKRRRTKDKGAQKTGGEERRRKTLYKGIEKTHTTSSESAAEDGRKKEERADGGRVEGSVWCAQEKRNCRIAANGASGSCGNYFLSKASGSLAGGGILEDCHLSLAGGVVVSHKELDLSDQGLQSVADDDSITECDSQNEVTKSLTGDSISLDDCNLLNSSPGSFAGGEGSSEDCDLLDEALGVRSQGQQTQSVTTDREQSRLPLRYEAFVGLSRPLCAKEASIRLVETLSQLHSGEAHSPTPGLQHLTVSLRGSNYLTSILTSAPSNDNDLDLLEAAGCLLPDWSSLTSLTLDVCMLENCGNRNNTDTCYFFDALLRIIRGGTLQSLFLYPSLDEQGWKRLCRFFWQTLAILSGSGPQSSSTKRSQPMKLLAIECSCLQWLEEESIVEDQSIWGDDSRERSARDISEEMDVFVSDISSGPGLEELHLNLVGFTSSAVFGPLEGLLRGDHALRHLSLHESHLSQDSFDHLLHALGTGVHQSLACLDLSGSLPGVTEAQWRQLCCVVEHTPSLTTLSLVGCRLKGEQITEADFVRAVANRGKDRSFSVDLSYNRDLGNSVWDFMEQTVHPESSLKELHFKHTGSEAQRGATVMERIVHKHSPHLLPLLSACSWTGRYDEPDLGRAEKNLRQLASSVVISGDMKADFLAMM